METAHVKAYSVQSIMAFITFKVSKLCYKYLTFLGIAVGNAKVYPENCSNDEG